MTQMPYSSDKIEYCYTTVDDPNMRGAEYVRNKSTCYKQKTGALITDKKGRFLAAGNNEVEIPQENCPRIGMETGTGYDLCQSACGGNLHAEVSALNNLMPEDKPYAIYLYGHWWCCENCCKELEFFGIKKVYLVEGHGPETDWSKV